MNGYMDERKWGGLGLAPRIASSIRQRVERDLITRQGIDVTQCMTSVIIIVNVIIIITIKLK